jgi:hypothetical protein
MTGNEKVLTAREAFTDCLQFWNESNQPSLKQQQQHGRELPNVVFEGELIPEGEFEVSIKAPHSALPLLVARYPAAEFSFSVEREPIPGTSYEMRQTAPLNSLYAEFTIDFTPYGTILPGSDNDNGGNGTHHSAFETEDESVDPVTVSGPNPGPSVELDTQPEIAVTS